MFSFGFFLLIRPLYASCVTASVISFIFVVFFVLFFSNILFFFVYEVLLFLLLSVIVFLLLFCGFNKVYMLFILPHFLLYRIGFDVYDEA